MLRKNTLNKKKISLSLYKKIIDFMPICCVDVVFKVGKKIYLFRRAYEPAKNEWWLIGGRVLKGEHLNEAVIRKVKEEIGIDTNIVRMIGVYENFLRKNRFNTKNENGTHSISICFLVKPKEKDFSLNLNEEYTDYKIITKTDKNLHPYVKSVLKDCGVK